MTVPSKWIVGDNLCWPNNNNQVSTLFRQMADPKDSWKQIQITRQLYQGTREECDNISSGTEYDSQPNDINARFVCDDEVPLFRNNLSNVSHRSSSSPRNPASKVSDCPQFSSSTLSASGSQNDSQILLKKRKRVVLYDDDDDDDENITSAISSSLKQRKRVFEDDDYEYCEESISFAAGTSSSSTPKSSVLPSLTTPNPIIGKKTGTTESRLANIERDIRTINKRQESLMTMMVRIHEAVKAKRSLTDDSELPFLTSKEEFDILKEKLSDQQEKKKLIDQLKRIGGKDCKMMAYAIINRTMSIQFQGQCNLAGNNGKVAFGVGDFYKAILVAITSRHPESSEKQVREDMGKKFKNAPDVKGGVGRKRETSNELN